MKVEIREIVVTTDGWGCLERSVTARHIVETDSVNHALALYRDADADDLEYTIIDN